MDTQTLYAKLAIVPQEIKIWLGSDAVIDIIDNIPKKYNLPETSSATISKLIQKMEIKGIGAEYFMGELSLELNLDKNKILPIIEEIKKDIFTPIKDDLSKYGIDLSQLEKFNLPTKSAEAIQPKIVSEVGPSGAMPKLAFSPSSLSTAASAAKPAAAAPAAAISKPAAATTPAASKPVSVVLSGISGAPIMSTKIPAPSEGKFASGWSKAPAPSIPSVPASGPAPVMLHEDAKFFSAEKAEGFHLSRPGGGAEVSLEGIQSQQKVKPAVVELGTLSSTPTPPTAATPKFMHYTEFKSSLPAASATSPASSATPASTPRNITEITSATAKPATAPATQIPAMPTIKVSSPATPASPTPAKINPLSQKTISGVIPIPQPPTPPQPIQKNYP